MNSNQSTLEVLAKEGIPMTEEQLLSATHQTRSNHNGASTASEAASYDLTALERATWSIPALNEGRDETGAATQPAPAEERRRGVLIHRIVSVPRVLLLFPFKAMRQLYWLMDPDAKIRSQGLQTVGSVVTTDTSSRVVTDPESGTERTVYTHSVRYIFDADGRTHSRRKTVDSLGNLKAGSPLRVYYLPDTDSLDSAIDTEPRAVA